MTTTVIDSPPGATFETTAVIIQRHGHYEDQSTEPDWVARSQKHCELMAPMSNDKRFGYLRAVGCGEDNIRMIAQAIEETLAVTAKPSLRAVARKCVEDSKDIEHLLEKWPEHQHFELLSTSLAKLDDEERSLANAYAACQIYETAATALYLAIVDNLPPASEVIPYNAAMQERDRAIADGGYEDEVAGWPK